MWQPSIWLKLIHSDSTWWWQPSWILPCLIVPSWIQPFAQKNFTHAFSLNLMMAAILNSAILDSAILHKSLIQSNSIWFKLIHSDSTWWWQPSWILPFWIQSFAQKKLHSCILTQIDDGSHLEFCYLGFSHFAQKSSLVHSDSTWWWQPSWTLPCWIETLPSCIQTASFLSSDLLRNTLPPLWLCLKLIPSD